MLQQTFILFYFILYCIVLFYQNKALQVELLQACKRLNDHEQAIASFKKSEFSFRFVPFYSTNFSRL